jgi:hypothetical protein
MVKYWEILQIYFSTQPIVDLCSIVKPNKLTLYLLLCIEWKWPVTIIIQSRDKIKWFIQSKHFEVFWQKEITTKNNSPQQLFTLTKKKFADVHLLNLLLLLFLNLYSAPWSGVQKCIREMRSLYVRGLTYCSHTLFINRAQLCRENTDRCIHEKRSKCRYRKAENLFLQTV